MRQLGLIVTITRQNSNLITTITSNRD